MNLQVSIYFFLFLGWALFWISFCSPSIFLIVLLQFCHQTIRTARDPPEQRRGSVACRASHPLTGATCRLSSRLVSRSLGWSYISLEVQFHYILTD